jgi:hypothetical protein
MKKTTQIIIIFCLSAVSSLSLALTQAYVDAGEIGQGFLLKRLDTCYLVSPAHVIGEEFFAAIITNSNNHSTGEAEPLETFGYDLTLLRLEEGEAKEDCQDDIDSFKAIDSVLISATRANLNSVNADGSQSYVPLDLTDSGIQYLRVKARSNDMPLYKGLSGSVVYIKDIPVGILQSVDNNTNEGIVLRMDRVITTITPYFSANHFSNKITKIQKKGNLGGGIPLSFQSWTHPPLNAQHRITHLLDNDPSTLWGTVFPNEPVSLVAVLGDGTTSQTFTQLILGTAKKGSSSMPRDFEILVSTKLKGRRGWRSILSATWMKNKTTKVINFAPIKAKRMKIIFYSNWGGERLKISSISLL